MSLLILGIDDEADLEAPEFAKPFQKTAVRRASFDALVTPRNPMIGSLVLRDVAITPERLEKEMKVIGVPDWCNLHMKRLR